MLLLLINDPWPVNESYEVVEALLREFWRLRFINVIAIRNNYKTSQLFYRFNPFPTFQLESVKISPGAKNQKEIYPYRLNDLRGYELPIIIGGTDPRIIPYNLANGQLFIGGYVGHYVSAFAQKYNCTYHQPLPYKPDKAIGSQDLAAAVINGTVEWSAAITHPDIPYKGSTYPYDIINSCTMTPVEANVPGYKFYTLVFKGETYVLVICTLLVMSMVLSAALYIYGHKPDLFDIVCHNDCLRGILGQPFSEILNAPVSINALYLDISILGIILTTTYNAYYSTYMTKAPKETEVSTFDDALATGLKIIMWTAEYKGLMKRFPEFQKYTSIFVQEPSLQKFLHKRDSFNTKFGYTAPSPKWIIVNEQQKMFTTPLFKQPPGFCFFINNPQCFPINENSVFISLHHQLILEIYQAGLLNHWKEYSFIELLKAKKIHLSDLSEKPHFSPMTVHNLKYILICLGIMFVVVIIVFIVELLIFYRRRICTKLRNWFDKIVGNSDIDVDYESCNESVEIEIL